MSLRFKTPEWMAKRAAVSITLTDEEGAIYEWKGQPYAVIGRSEAATVKLPIDAISREHLAIVEHSNGNVYAIDLQSSQGTLVNEEELGEFKPKRLHQGDVLSLSKGTKVLKVTELESRKRKAEESSKGPSEVRCSHILVKHNKSRRPASWKNPNITISKEEALKQLQRLRERVEREAKETGSLEKAFASVASSESDCSSARKGGDLGFFGRGAMQPAFEKAAFELDVGQMSSVVDSDSGVHFILRTA